MNSKNVISSNPQILNIISPKFQGSLLGLIQGGASEVLCSCPWLIGQIDEKGMNVAQPMLLSGCPTKGRVSAKDTKFAFLALKRHFSGQPDNHIG